MIYYGNKTQKYIENIEISRIREVTMCCQSNSTLVDASLCFPKVPYITGLHFRLSPRVQAAFTAVLSPDSRPPAATMNLWGCWEGASKRDLFSAG